MLKRQLDRFAHALLEPVNKAAIFILGLYTVLWGLWVVNPWWQVFTTAKLYSALVGFPPAFVSAEVFFGCLAIICGLLTTIGAIKLSYRSLTAGASIAFFHWMMIAIFYFMGDWHNTGGITALTFAVYAGFVWLNLRVNKRHGDDGWV